MFYVANTTLLREIFEEVCAEVPRQATETRVLVADNILRCAKGGGYTLDELRAAGRLALVTAKARQGSVMCPCVSDGVRQE
jgi:hypothetical protein